MFYINLQILLRFVKGFVGGWLLAAGYWRLTNLDADTLSKARSQLPKANQYSPLREVGLNNGLNEINKPPAGLNATCQKPEANSRKPK